LVVRLPKIRRWHSFIKRLTETFVSILLCSACVSELHNNGLVERLITMDQHLGEYSMDKNEIRINLVIGIRQDSVANRINVTTDRANELWLDAKTLDEDDLDFLQSALSEKEQVVIEFNSNTKEIQLAYYPITDVIFVLSEHQEENMVQVHALKRPTLCFLRKEHPRFNELYARLSQANVNQRKGVTAALAIPPGSQYIEDVLVLEPSKAD